MMTLLTGHFLMVDNSTGTFLMGAYTAGLRISPDSGATWAITLPINVTSFAVVGSTLFAGTYSDGVWRHAL